MNSNEPSMRAYLAAVEAWVRRKTMSEFCTAEMTFQRFPHRLAAHGRVRRGDELRVAGEPGRKFGEAQP